MGKVVFIACTPVCRAMINEIKSNPDLDAIDIAGIVNLNSRVAIHKANYDSYNDLVLEYNIPIFYCDNINDDEAIAFIIEREPDIIIQSGWSQKFNSSVLNAAKYGCIGEHPAPLPKGRGAACVNWAIITGETSWGDTFFKMEDKYDTGLIYAQKSFEIESYDNVKTVYDKVSKAAMVIIRENILSWCNGNFQDLPQDDTEATYYNKRRPSDGQFSFHDSAINLHNKIRGQTRPYPGAFFQANIDGCNKNIYVWDSEYTGERKEGENNKVVLKKTVGGVGIVCGDGKMLTIKRVQVEKDPETWAYDLFKNADIHF